MNHGLRDSLKTVTDRPIFFPLFIPWTEFSGHASGIYNTNNCRSPHSVFRNFIDTCTKKVDTNSVFRHVNFAEMSHNWRNYNKRAMMALDPSPESFSPQMNFTSLFLGLPTCDPWGGVSFNSKGHHVNKIDKDLQGDALSFPVSEKKNF